MREEAKGGIPENVDIWDVNGKRSIGMMVEWRTRKVSHGSERRFEGQMC